MKIAARAKAAQPFHAMSIGERAGILQAEGHSPSSAWASRTSVLLLLSAKRCAA